MLFGVDIKGLVTANLRGQLNPVTLHQVNATLGSYGERLKSETSHNGEGVRLKWDAKLALARGYPMTAAKILILADGMPRPANDDEVVVMGDRYRVIDVETDPVEAAWIVAGVLMVAGTRPAIDPDAQEW